MNSPEKKSTARGLRSLAAFVAPALIGLVVVGAVIAWKQELFVTRTPIYIFTDSALGITKGIPVKVFGLTVGSVDDIEIVASTPGNRGQVRVRLSIGSEYLHHITKDSRAKLMREGVVGQALIEILPGDQSVRPVARNEVIAFERGKTLGELSEDLNRALSPVLAQVKEAIGDMQNPQGRLQKTVDRVTTLLDELPDSNRRLASVLVTAERTIARADSVLVNADKAVAGIALKADSTLGNLDKIVAEVSAAAPSIMKNLDTAAQGLARASDRVPLLIDGGQTLVRDANQAVTGAKGAWPLRNWIEAPATTTLGIDSGEAGF
ncbi:MAG: phospholipid/cholesterol/gamma-HCH transport system substrate-binding protein [Betaproteobacteria bacterium]|jgi:ABC-type transporter Mla subunit MlaD|nr:phospholipid/cholesterol/gamma-HCH transport system substrate-binding protein [Betaproteobacteria bacterium]